jgi:hypothetical protein
VLPTGLKTLEQLAVIVDADAGHMRIIATGVFDHEDLKCQRPFFSQPRNFFRHRAGWIVIEVDDGVLAVMFDERAITLHRCRRRIDVGHADGSRHTAGRRGHGRRRNILFVSETGIAMMRVGVDQAGNDFFAFSVDDRIGARPATPGGLPSATILPSLTAMSATMKPPGVHTSPFLTSKSNLAMNLNSPFADCEKSFI